MNFPFSSTLNSFFLPTLHLTKGGNESKSERSLLEISDVSISDLSIHDDPVAAETSFVVRVPHPHRSQRPSPYQSRKSTNLPSLKRDRAMRHLSRIPESRLHSSDESPIPTMPGRRRTLSEPSSVPSLMSVSNAGKYKCVHVKSPGTVVHPDTDDTVLHLKEDPPAAADINLDELKASLMSTLSPTCINTSPCTCQSIVTAEHNPKHQSLLNELNNWCVVHLGSPSPGWNAIQVLHAGSSSNTMKIPDDSPFCVMQLGGSYTLQIFPNTKSLTAHNLLLEVPLGPLSTVLVTDPIAKGSTITAVGTPGPLPGDPTPIQLIPIHLPSTAPIPPVTKGTGMLALTHRANDATTPTSPDGKCTVPHGGNNELEAGPNLNLDPPQKPPGGAEASNKLRNTDHRDDQSLTLELDQAQFSPDHRREQLGYTKSEAMSSNNPGPRGSDTVSDVVKVGVTATPRNDALPNTAPSQLPEPEDPEDSLGKIPIAPLRPKGLFIGPRISKFVMSKIKRSELATLAAGCDISFSNEEDTKTEVECALINIYEGTAPLSGSVAKYIAEKLNNKQVNELLDRHHIYPQGRPSLSDRRKLLMNHWLLQKQPSATSASGKHKKKKKKTDEQSPPTSPAEGKCALVGSAPCVEAVSSEAQLPSQGSIGEQIGILERSILELRSETDKNSHCIDLLLDEDPRKTKKAPPSQDDQASLLNELKVFHNRLAKLEDESKRVLQLCETIRKNREAIDEVICNMEKMKENQERYEERLCAQHADETVRKNREAIDEVICNMEKMKENQERYEERLCAQHTDGGMQGVLTVHQENLDLPDRPTYRRALLRNNDQAPGVVRRIAASNQQSQPSRHNPSQGSLNRSAAVGPTKRKVVLLHDGTYDKFDPSLFVNRYEVTVVHCPSLRKATSDGSIVRHIESLNPFSVLVHLGSKDIYDGRPVETLVSEVNTLSLRLTKTAHTCFSLPIIPQAAGLRGFIDKMTEFHSLVSDLITTQRKTPQRGMNKKPFTCSKPMLTPMARVVTTAPHIVITKPAGHAKLWLKVRDALDRMSGLRPPRDRSQVIQADQGAQEGPESNGEARHSGSNQSSQPSVHGESETNDPPYVEHPLQNAQTEAEEHIIAGSTATRAPLAPNNADEAQSQPIPVSTHMNSAPMQQNSDERTDSQ